MRAFCLAVYADTLAEHALAAESRIEQGRQRLSRAAIEHEARRCLPSAVAARLETIGVLAPLGERKGGFDAAREEIERAIADRAAIMLLQRWVDAQRGDAERGTRASCAVPRAAA